MTATAGDYDAGKALTLTLHMSEAVNVTGTPTLTLNDGGTASYVSGSGTSTLTFSYTVAAGQNTAALQVTGVSGTITDLAGNALSSTGLPETVSGVTIDTTAPTVSSVTATAGDYDAGKALTLTLNYERGGERHRHADADAQRRRHRHLCQRLRHERADVQLHGGGRAEHPSAGGDGVHRNDKGPRRQCAEQHRPAGDRQRRHHRHHGADGIVGDGDRGRLRRRQDGDPDAQH